MKISLKNRKLDTIRVREDNPKLHPDWHVEQIADSIKAHGFNDPIAVDEDGFILEGHGRFAAACLLKLKTVPTIELAGLSEAQKKAYVIAHNKLTMNTGFDADALVKQLQEIEGEFTGFSQDEIDELVLDALQAGIPEPPVNKIGASTQAALEFVSMSFLMTPAQRDQILKAIDKAKADQRDLTMADALVTICQQFTEGD